MFELLNSVSYNETDNVYRRQIRGKYKPVMTCVNAAAAGESGTSLTNDRPSSLHCPTHYTRRLRRNVLYLCALQTYTLPMLLLLFCFTGLLRLLQVGLKTLQIT